MKLPGLEDTAHMQQQDTIAVAMSGGVDSSAVAALLHAQGHPLIGLTLQLWNQRRLAGREGMPESVQGRCCSIDDVYDARRVAEHLGIPYYLVNAQDRFESEVIRPFVSEYLAGRTPIPCTLCNNHLKFDQLLLTARQAQGDPNAGTGYELDAIAASVLGGASLFGARGSIVGTFLGVLLVQILTNGLNLLNFDPQVARIVEGALLIAFVYIDHWRKRRLATA